VSGLFGVIGFRFDELDVRSGVEGLITKTSIFDGLLGNQLQSMPSVAPVWRLPWPNQAPWQPGAF